MRAVVFAGARTVEVPDAFVTGWHAAELARVYPGRTAAVFGRSTSAPTR
jgi:hypothetical protein